MSRDFRPSSSRWDRDAEGGASKRGGPFLLHSSISYRAKLSTHIISLFLSCLLHDHVAPVSASNYQSCKAISHLGNVLTEIISPYWTFVAPGPASEAERNRVETTPVSVDWLLARTVEKSMPADRGIPGRR
ncbi:unnamed protein product [Amoebophrya sp. A25]|nr:unnamed protein product [Amoebophrya sp. A25]|eukprot:GSA25T00014217001.1